MSFLYSSWVLEETNLNLSRNSLWRSNLTYQTDHPSPFVASSPYQGSCFAKQRVAVSIKLDRPCGFVFQIWWRVSSRCWRSSYQLVSEPYDSQVCLSIFFLFFSGLAYSLLFSCQVVHPFLFSLSNRVFRCRFPIFEKKKNSFVFRLFSLLGSWFGLLFEFVYITL